MFYYLLFGKDFLPPSGLVILSCSFFSLESDSFFLDGVLLLLGLSDELLYAVLMVSLVAFLDLFDFSQDFFLELLLCHLLVDLESGLERDAKRNVGPFQLANGPWRPCCRGPGGLRHVHTFKSLRHPRNKHPS